VHVAAGAYLGTGCTVREHLTVGAWSTIGMGAVVLCDVPPHEVWAGVPARQLRSTPTYGAAGGLRLSQDGGPAVAEGNRT
jgi:acetyltransferase-like isoleucine patch superfamily enzyme